MIDDKRLLTEAGFDIGEFSDTSVRYHASILRNLIGRWGWMASLPSVGGINWVKAAMKVATVTVEQEMLGPQPVERNGVQSFEPFQRITMSRRSTATRSSESSTV